MMGRTFLLLGLLGTAAFVAAGALGYGFLREEGLRLHLLVGLGACLLLLFSQSWIVIYLLGTSRVVRGWIAQTGSQAGGKSGGAAGEPLGRAATAWGRQSLPWGLLAAAAAVASFVLGSASFAGTAPAWLHHACFYVALAAQLWALRVEWRALEASERLIGVLDRRAAGDAG